MSNIYNRRLDYEVLPSGKRVLEYPTKTIIPEYTVVGNTKPNLDYQTNRMLQPIFSTKKPIQQTPFLPKNPISATGLGGRKPVQIDYVIPPRKPKQPMGLTWEPNTIREMRQNVYPDGLPKNTVPAQSADSAYLEKQHAEREIQRLESLLKYAREHPEQKIDVARLEKLKEDRSYVVNPYKNVALSVDGHRKMAEREAKAIRDELQLLREKGRENIDDLLYGIDKKLDNLESVRIEKGQKALEEPVMGEFGWMLNIKENQQLDDVVDKVIAGLQAEMKKEQYKDIEGESISVEQKLQQLKRYDWNKISDEEKERIVKDLALSKSAQKKLARLGRRIVAKELKAEEKREIMEKVEPKKELLSELKGRVRRKSSAKMEEAMPLEMEEKEEAVIKYNQYIDKVVKGKTVKPELNQVESDKILTTTTYQGLSDSIRALKPEERRTESLKLFEEYSKIDYKNLSPKQKEQFVKTLALAITYINDPTKGQGSVNSLVNQSWKDYSSKKGAKSTSNLIKNIYKKLSFKGKTSRNL